MRVRNLNLVGGLMALLCLSSAALLAAGHRAPQGQAAPQRPPATPPQFRTGVELIQLDVTVLDKDRQPVRGLTAEDFTVLDNGQPAPIRAFTPVEVEGRTRASEAVWANEVAPDVVTNRVSEEEGRLVVIMLDRSIPLEQPTKVARQIATAAVDALGPHDLGAVVATGLGAAVQNLTSDRERLKRAINTGDPSTGISEFAESLMAANSVANFSKLSDPRCLCGLCVLESITRVAEAVEQASRRRKVLFFIGSNITWQASGSVMAAGEDIGCESRIKDARAAMFAAVDRANLTVHSIDPQGLVNVGPQVSATSRGGVGAGAAAARARQQQLDTTNNLAGQQSLAVLPSRTGGRTIVARNNPETIVPAIFRESESYYVIGIERAISARADGTRSVEVKVGRKGVKVYATRLYVAPGPPRFGVSASADEAIRGLMPSGAVPLGLGVTAFANPESASGKPVVRINVDAGAFARGDRAAVPLEVAVMAVDGSGRSVASARQTSTVAVTGGRGAAPEVNVQSHLELAPGDYGIRVAVSDPATNRVASVFSDVSVPAFATAPVSLSGVSVEVPSTTGPAATTRRVFRRQEQVRAVLQIYQGTERTDPIAPVSMRVQILDAKGIAVRDQALPFAESAFTNRRADCVITLPLAKLPAGEYLLKLEASIDKRTSGRALRFAVE